MHDLRRTPTNAEQAPTAERDFAVLRAYLAPVGPMRTADAILCFGCSGESVPARAAAVFKLGLAPWVVVSGLGPAHRDEPEADEFARTLVRCGVPEQQIVLERSARNIGENVTFGLAAAHRHGVVARSVIVVSHVDATRRCLATIRHRAPSVAAHPSPFARRVSGPVRASAAGAALRELQRLRTYPARGYITAQREPPVVTAAALRLERSLLPDGASPTPLVTHGVVAAGTGLESQQPPLFIGQ